MSRISIGKKLRAHRLKIDITQIEMGEAVGVSKASISAYEKGKVAVAVEMFEKIMAVKKSDVLDKTGKGE